MAHIGERDAERVALFKLGDRGDDEEAFTLTFENLRDDSVRDERHRLRLRRDTGEWRVVEDEVTYRCHEGRGQQEFAAGLCG